MKLINNLLLLTIFLTSINRHTYASNELKKEVIKSSPVTASSHLPYSGEFFPADCPTLAVAVTNPVNCGEAGSLNFTFTNVPNGTYSIVFNTGNFANVVVTNNKAKVNSFPRTYLNLKITVDGCTSPNGVNATVLEGALPAPPVISVEDRCGESVLTASDYTGTLLWSTGETTESISVTEAGNYTVSQTVNGCTSDLAATTAAPKAVPAISVLGTDPEQCFGEGSLEFTFTDVPNGVYNIPYDGGEFTNLIVIDNKSELSIESGDYNNLKITINGCVSENGVNITLSDPPTPSSPDVNVENRCDESILTASNYTGTLLWSTGETTESIVVTEAGEYTVTQTVDGCISDATVVTAAPKVTPVLSVLAQDPEHCVFNGKLIFTFTDVPDDTYTIFYDGGNFSEVDVSGNSATIDAGSGTYNNLIISVDGCESAQGVNAVIDESDQPYPPIISVENNCGESVLTATAYSGILLWSTGETTTSITVTEAGDYSVRQIVNDCLSDPAITTATPKTIPTISVNVTDPVECSGLGTVDFTFAGIPDGNYSISYTGGQINNITIAENKATVELPAGSYNNLTIEFDGCISEDGVDVIIDAPSNPEAPEILVENGCGETVLTVSNSIGTLLWSTGETTQSIRVTEAGEYGVSQTIDGCTSEPATAIASPKEVPMLSVTAINPQGCYETGTLEFSFSGVPDGNYTLYYDGGSFTDVEISGNTAGVIAQLGDYFNLYIVVDGCSSEKGINAQLTAPQSAGDLGNNVVYPYISSEEYVRAIPVITPQNANINSISIYHEGGTGNVLLAVYSDLGGKPKTRLGITPSTPISSKSGWQTINLEKPVSITQNQKFWLAWVFQNNPGIRYTTGKPGRATTLKTWSSGLPITFFDVTLADYNYSLYCSYTYNEPPPTPNITAESQCGQTVLTATDYTGTLLWSTGETTKSIIVDQEGTYSVNQTINGCVSEDASIQVVPKLIPTLAVTKTNPQVCDGNGFLEFTFTNVPDGDYSIHHDQGEFSNVAVAGNKAVVETPAGSYFNLKITVGECTSASGISAVLTAPDAPLPPQISVENNCGESVLTASGYSGTLLWNTGETSESMIVTEPGDYLVTQTANGCMSDAATITAAPKTIPALAVTVNKPENCVDDISLEFSFTGVPDGNYTIYFTGGTFASVAVRKNSASVKVLPGNYYNLTITIDGCTSANGVNAEVSSTEPPPPPAISVENLCGESIISVTNYTGSLLWNNGETAETITVTEAGDYWVTQSVGGCTSEAATITAAPKSIPTISVSAVNPKVCNENGALQFEFTNVPDGNYTITYTGGTFTDVAVSGGSALVNATAGTYNNLKIEVNGCLSAETIKAVISDPNPPAAPQVVAEDNCGESVLTASGFSGTLKWNTGETTSSITVIEAGEYTVAQTVGGCTSDGASIMALPKAVPAVPDFSVVNECDNISVLTALDYEPSAVLKWSTGESDEIIMVNASGTYELKQIIDGCESETISKLVQPKPSPVLNASVINPENCGEPGTINFSFSNVPDGFYTINYEGGRFENVGITGQSASVQAENGTYNNLSITVDGCSSTAQINVEVSAPNAIALPKITVENKCGESILTVTESLENATLLWSTNETSKSITVFEAGNYYVSQSFNGCKSSEAVITASPYSVPGKPLIELQQDCGDATVLIGNLESDAWLYWQINGITDSTKSNIINLAETGSYRFYQKVGDCISEAALITIHSYSAPDPPVSMGNKIVCETQPMPQLFAEATPPDGFSVVWYTQPIGGSALASPSLDQVGSVTYYAESQNSTGNCTSATRTPVTLTIKQSPASLITEENIVGKPYSHVAVLVFPEESYKYQWYLNNNEIAGAKSQYYYISSSDRKDGNVFSVKIELENGCSSVYAYAYPTNLTSGEITGIDHTKSVAIPGSLVVYPNPAINKVFVAPDGYKIEENQKLAVKIFSINGTCVIDTPLEIIPKSINVESLRPGVYSVALYRNNDLLGTKNLIIRK